MKTSRHAFALTLLAACFFASSLTRKAQAGAPIPGPAIVETDEIPPVTTKLSDWAMFSWKGTTAYALQKDIKSIGKKTLPLYAFGLTIPKDKNCTPQSLSAKSSGYAVVVKKVGKTPYVYIVDAKSSADVAVVKPSAKMTVEKATTKNLGEACTNAANITVTIPALAAAAAPAGKPAEPKKESPPLKAAIEKLFPGSPVEQAVVNYIVRTRPTSQKDPSIRAKMDKLIAAADKMGTLETTELIGELRNKVVLAVPHFISGAKDSGLATLMGSGKKIGFSLTEAQLQSYFCDNWSTLRGTPAVAAKDIDTSLLDKQEKMRPTTEDMKTALAAATGGGAIVDAGASAAWNEAHKDDYLKEHAAYCPPFDSPGEKNKGSKLDSVDSEVNKSTPTPTAADPNAWRHPFNGMKTGAWAGFLGFIAGGPIGMALFGAAGMVAGMWVSEQINQ